MQAVFTTGGFPPAAEACHESDLVVTCGTMVPKRVLIVDDDPNQCSGVCKLLSRRKINGAVIEGECAQTIEEGLACLAAQQFDLVVLDMGFPESGPFETLERVPEFTKHCPVVCMTGNDDRKLLGRLRSMKVQWVIKGEGEESAGAGSLILEKILMGLALNDQSPELADASLEAQRAIDHALHSEHENDTMRKPWVLKWAPALSLALALTIASATLGGYLMRWIVDRTTSAVELSRRIETREQESAVQSRAIEKALDKLNALEAKAQAGEADRSSLHRDVAVVSASQKELKEDVMRGIERIEQGQRDVLKIMLERK